MYRLQAGKSQTQTKGEISTTGKGTGRIMLEKIYQQLWFKIGGRPWTYIIRENPRWGAAVGSGLAAIGFLSLRFSKPLILIVGAGIGFILGHLYW